MEIAPRTNAPITSANRNLLSATIPALLGIQYYPALSCIFHFDNTVVAPFDTNHINFVRAHYGRAARLGWCRTRTHFPHSTFTLPFCHPAILTSCRFSWKGGQPLWCSRESTPLISFCNLHLANKGVNAVADRNDSLLCSSPRAKCFPASQPVSQLASHLAAGQDNTSQSVYISMDKSFGSSSPRKTHATHC